MAGLRAAILIGMIEKPKLRRAALARRRAMAPAEVARKSAAIVNRLMALDAVRAAPVLLSYISSKDNEVDTHRFVDRLLTANRTVLAPVAENRGLLAWSRLENLSELAPGRFGILEPMPAYRRLVVPPTNAPVLVPGIAFSRTGRRIGYGGGYYDRFLAGHPGPKIGLAFELQIIDEFDAFSHDVPVDVVVTESAVYNRREGC